MKLCIIPARGGSKRIPRKNIKEFLGKPIIAYSIQCAIASGIFDKIIVSTDDEEIAKIALEYGAEVPFIRPKEIADDITGTIPVIRHAIRESEKIYGEIDVVCCIYPTAPLLNAKFLLQGAEKLVQNLDLEFVFSAAEYEAPIFRSFQLVDDKVDMFWPENFEKRSQDLPKAFFDAGQFYFGRKQAFMSNEVLFAKYSSVVLLPRYLVQDVDNISDWQRLEVLYRLLNKC